MFFITKMVVAGTFLYASLANVMAQNVTLYTSYPAPDIEIVQQVTKSLTGLDVGVVNGSSSVMMRRIEAEGVQPGGDLFWSSSANTVAPFEAYFEPYQASALEVIPESLHYQGGHIFLPCAIGVITLMVNSDHLGDLPMPEKWSDLARPEWAGKIIMPNPESSSTGYTIIWGLSQLLEEANYKQIIANVAIAGSTQAVPSSVSSGEYVVGIIYENYPHSYIEGGQDEIRAVYPQDGTFINVEYAGIIKDAPNPQQARQVMDAILSQEGQAELLKQRFRRPVRNDIRVSDYFDSLPEFSEIAIFATNEHEAAAARDTILGQWRALPKGN